jgi:hypothetical protein
MKVTVALDEKLDREVRKIALDRDTSLTALVREYFEQFAAESATVGRKRRQHKALQRSFAAVRLRIGKRNWKREVLHERG